MSPTRVLMIWAALALVWAGVAGAQQEASPDPGPEVTSEQVQTAVAELSSATDLEESVRNAASDLLTRAQEQLKRAGEAAVRKAEFESQAAGAAKRLEELKAELAKPAETPKASPPADATVSQLEQGVSQSKADAEAGRRKVSELEAEAALRSERLGAIPGQIAQLRQELEEVGSRVQSAATPQTLLERARVYFDRALRQALRAEIEALEAEQRSYEARRELLPARLDRARRQVKTAEALVADWQRLVDEARRSEAKKAEQEAARMLEGARQHPVLESFANETKQFTEGGGKTISSRAIASRLSEVADERRETREEITDLVSSFRETQRDIGRAGLKRTTGQRMLREYNELPETSDLRDQLRETEDAWERAYDSKRELEEWREDLQDVDGVVDRLLREMNEASADEELLTRVARELVVSRRQLLDGLILDHEKYIEELEFLQDELAEQIEWTSSYRSYVEERILWVRTLEMDRAFELEDYRNGASWLIDPEGLRRSLVISAEECLEQPVSTLLSALVLFCWFWVSVRLRRVIRELGARTGSYKTDAFRYTVYVVGLTLIVATPYPVLLYWLGWLLARPPGQVDPGGSLGEGLQFAAFYIAPLFALYKASMPGGLGDEHFRWPDGSLRAVRRHLHWFIPTLIPILVLIEAAARSENEAVNASLGRVALLLGMIAVSVVSHRLLRPRGPLKAFFERNPGSLVTRLRVLWFPLAVGAPLALALLSWLGFQYSASQLHESIELTLALILVLVLLNSLLQRWLFLARRWLAVEEARRRREQALAEAKAAEEAGSAASGKVDVPAFDEARIDLPAISAQSKQLFRSTVVLATLLGLWVIWADMIPALRFLDRVQLWPEARLVEEQHAALITLDGALGGPSGGQASPSAPSNGASANSGAASAAPANGSGASAPSGNGGRASGGGGSGSNPQTALLTNADSPSAAGAHAPFALTLGDLAMALIALLVTYIAFKNLPGLVEMLVIQRLPLDAGARYALSTVLRYVIAIIGLSISASAIGLSWSNVQWLAAALTFGLAFGLQEIFANFVSGLIILAERPIRLGDTVTVGQTSGTVTRIRMRATTITDWDRKEMVIPNKNFITNDVVNWTLSDPVLRVIIPVGVSYGSDVDKVERTLFKIARAHKVVLEDPKPQVWFTGFGDSTLNFELRAFIPHIDYLLKTKHELHNAVFKEFKKAGIEIAFPQRDLHIRTSEGLKELVQKREDLRIGHAGDGI